MAVAEVNAIDLIFSQLVSYEPQTWIAFVAIAFFASRFGGLFGILASHAIVGIIVVLLDVRWITTEMHAPNWNGVPDMDFVFMVGVILRVLLVNAVLLPIALLSLRLRKSKSLAPQKPPEVGTL